MSVIRLISLTLITMLCFAGNSVFCRLALRQTSIDAASFTSVRLISGALMLILLVHARQRWQGIGAAQALKAGGNWVSASALFVYASAFSFSYADMATGIGALLLFGAVQATMILTGLWRGERLNRQQSAGLIMAFAGVVAILSPGLDAPPIGSALLMLISGVAWGVYSLRGRGVADPTGDTAGNFLRATPMSVLLSALLLTHQQLDPQGVLYAVLSGAITSGLGYAIWYAVLPQLTRTRAAAVQLSVPVLASLAGALFVDEPITLSLLLTSSAVLGGIALVVYGRRSTA
ncbi:MAG: EamA family transporter [Comamonadaceae bacterium CG_4_9_14_3_um_filter_60_33]|nr:MAG: EamA family transporter [Comamonadaceae bacterium CG_4_10_14_3_um_filter_60_42]PJB44075.1 MAG: EamA family transporter [Comamonadaceae bacterium CG_4_9_14_3_um_filter_60_33]